MKYVIKFQHLGDTYYARHDCDGTTRKTGGYRACFDSKVQAMAFLKAVESYQALNYEGSKKFRVVKVTKKKMVLPDPRSSHEDHPNWFGVFIPGCNHPKIPIAIFMYQHDAEQWVGFNKLAETGLCPSEIREIPPG